MVTIEFRPGEEWQSVKAVSDVQVHLICMIVQIVELGPTLLAAGWLSFRFQCHDNTVVAVSVHSTVSPADVHRHVGLKCVYRS